MKKITACAALLATLCQVDAAPAQAPRNFIWKISSPTGAIYLVGSVHLLTKDYYPLNPSLETAFKDSDLLVEEADLGELEAPASQFKLLTRGLLPGNQSLDTVLSASTYELVTKRVEALGVPLEPLKRFKPWMLALTLVQLEWQKAGFDGSLGLDRHFYDRARVDGKAVQGLETVDFQLSLFDGMSAEEQDRMLAGSLEDLDDERANVVRLIDAWKAGDAATVERLMLSDMEDDPIMYKRLLVDRNRAWLPRLDALLGRTGRAFVVVGAAHLVGPEGVLAMFRAKGYRVEQL
ncbi:MAG TPA: TraB/GumN family protein [Vicinamibacterales bacterium]|jgi:uncharacterized protein YbaP (TraB family)|nr:TraB/GumN family protein [Vicinamibacterales bacterium]